MSSAVINDSELMSSKEAALEAAKEIASHMQDPFAPLLDLVDCETAAATFKALSLGACLDPGDVVKAIVCLYPQEDLPKVVKGLLETRLAMEEKPARFFLNHFASLAPFGIQAHGPEFIGHALAGVLDDFTPNVARLLRAHFE